MPIQFSDFLQQANRATFGSRNIVVDDTQTPQNVKYGRFLFSDGQNVNDATMAAFKEALQQEYGVFGPMPSTLLSEPAPSFTSHCAHVISKKLYHRWNR